MPSPFLRIHPDSAEKLWQKHGWHDQIAAFRLPPRELTSVPRAAVTPELHSNPETASGGIYDQKGRHVAASRHLRRNKDFTAQAPPEAALPPGLPTLDGRHLYLGWFFDHYGHFILESLGRCWALQAAGPVDGYLFHRHPGARPPSPQLLYLLELLGIPPQKIRFIDAPLRVEELLVPTQRSVLARGMGPETLALYPEMAAKAWKLAGKPRENALFYISRRFLGPAMRLAANEWELENHFAEQGYRVLHPQFLDITRQLALYFKARRFAGLDGSGLHNVLFAEAPEEMWVLGAGNRVADAITQVELNRLKGCRTTLVLQEVAETRLLPPQLTPFLIQPPDETLALEPSGYDHFAWLMQLANQLTVHQVTTDESVSGELGLTPDEKEVLGSLLDLSRSTNEKPAEAEREGELASLLQAQRHLQASRFDEAATLLNGLLPEYRLDPQFLYHYAGVLRKAGRQDEALDIAEWALALDRENPRLSLLHAELLAEQGSGEAALEKLQELVDRWPRFFPARIRLAEFLARAERFEEAARQLQTALGESKGGKGPWNRLAWYLLRAGRLEEAREAAFKALELAPDNPFSRPHLARIHLQLGEYDQALHWIDRALEQNPGKRELQELRKQILSLRA